MSTYVVSDIHGELDRLISLMDMIDFSDKDVLYILGDVVDRGSDGIKILQYIMDKKNIRMLLGNHEYMCLRFFADDVTENERRRWNRNGNYTTLTGLDNLTEDEKDSVFDYLKNLPDSFDITVNGKKFYLVHGFTGNSTYERVWNRPEKDTVSNLTDTVVIIGHTPVCGFFCPDNDEDIYVYSRMLTDRGDHFRIYHAPGFIDIDCCCGYGLSAARLGCLRLEDNMEFYC